MRSKFFIDWKRGRISDTDSPDNGEKRFCCTISGDWVPAHNTAYRCDETVYGGLTEHFKQADLNIVNIESVIGDAGTKLIKPGPHHRCGREYLKILTDPPFHLACLANNHVKDYGVDGLLNTVSLLEEAGLDTVGAGENPSSAARPVRVEHEDIKLAIINAGEGAAALPENGGAGVASFDLFRLSKQIRGLKNEGYFVLGIFHVGREFLPIPPAYIYTALHHLADEGLDMIVCHHPHIVQGIEVYNDVPIFYSIGNFLFPRAPRTSPKLRTGLTVKFLFARNRLQTIELLPFEISSEQLILMEGEKKDEFLADLQYLSTLITAEKVEEFWGCYCRLFELEDILPPTRIKKRKPLHYYAALINRIQTPAHREVILSLARQKLKAQPDVDPWILDLMAIYQLTSKKRSLVVRKVRSAMRKIGGGR